jgi:transposase
VAEHDVKVSIGCLWKRLRQLGLTLKKSHCAPPSKIARTSLRPVRNGARASPI